MIDGPPLVISRLLLGSLLFYGGFFWGLRGWLDLDPQRRLICVAYIVSGLVLSGAGLLLWLCTLAP